MYKLTLNGEPAGKYESFEAVLEAIDRRWLDAIGDYTSEFNHTICEPDGTVIKLVAIYKTDKGQMTFIVEREDGTNDKN